MVDSPTSAGRILFEQFLKERFEAIQKTVLEGWQENLNIDFKCVEQNTAPITDKGRQTLAEALSGFANSEGGVIVWGVYAAPNSADDPDVAKELRPIDKIKRFLSDLESFSPQNVSPAVIGVEHIIIEDPAKPDTGYAVTYVPKGESEPHMARAKDQHRYYYRSGGSFLKMESFMVSDRYGRRPQPKLELYWQIAEGTTNGTGKGRNIDVYLILGIKNVGLGIAQYPALVVTQTDDFILSKHGLDGNGSLGLPERLVAQTGSTGRRFFVGGINHVIHPGTALEVTRVDYNLSISTQAWMRLPNYKIQNVKYELYCNGYSKIGEEIIHLEKHFLGIVYP